LLWTIAGLFCSPLFFGDLCCNNFSLAAKSTPCAVCLLYI
jgi:hypothetical protein